MGRRRNTTLLMLRAERQGQKSGEWVIKGDLYHSFYWIIIYTVIMKRILARINFCILVVWGFFVFKARDEQGYKMNEKIREKQMSRQGWSCLQIRARLAVLGPGCNFVPWSFVPGSERITLSCQGINLFPWTWRVLFSSCFCFCRISGGTFLEAKAVSEKWLCYWRIV